MVAVWPYFLETIRFRTSRGTKMFQANDAVVLKTGGQIMMVWGCGDIAGSPHVWCQWRDARGQVMQKTIPESALRPAAPK